MVAPTRLSLRLALDFLILAAIATLSLTAIAANWEPRTAEIGML